MYRRFACKSNVGVISCWCLLEYHFSTYSFLSWTFAFNVCVLISWRSTSNYLPVLYIRKYFNFQKLNCKQLLFPCTVVHFDSSLFQKYQSYGHIVLYFLSFLINNKKIFLWHNYIETGRQKKKIISRQIRTLEISYIHVLACLVNKHFSGILNI